jgi:hypothetical protein
MTMTRSREWLLLNAVETWLHYYEKSGTPSTIEQYKELQSEFHDAYMATLTKDVATEPSESTPTRTTRKRTAK